MIRDNGTHSCGYVKLKKDDINMMPKCSDRVSKIEANIEILQTQISNIYSLVSEIILKIREE